MRPSITPGLLVDVIRLRAHDESTVGNIIAGRAVSPAVAFRVARLAKVGVDDVLAGRIPAPGTSAHCGHVPEAAEAAQ